MLISTIIRILFNVLSYDVKEHISDSTERQEI